MSQKLGVRSGISQATTWNTEEKYYAWNLKTASIIYASDYFLYKKKEALKSVQHSQIPHFLQSIIMTAHFVPINH